MAAKWCQDLEFCHKEKPVQASELLKSSGSTKNHMHYMNNPDEPICEREFLGHISEKNDLSIIAMLGSPTEMYALDKKRSHP